MNWLLSCLLSEFDTNSLPNSYRSGSEIKSVLNCSLRHRRTFAMTSQFGSVRVRSRFVCLVLMYICIYGTYNVLRFSYLDWDSNHQLLASEDLVVSTRPSCHLTYCKTFTYINLKVALRIRRECAFSSVLWSSLQGGIAHTLRMRIVCVIVRYKVPLRMHCECGFCSVLWTSLHGRIAHALRMRIMCAILTTNRRMPQVSVI